MNFIPNALPSMTVGIPFITWDRMTRDAALSVINQSVPSWELILLCDGPEESLSSIPAEIVGDDRVRVVSNGVRRGLSHSLNRIADLAVGDLLFRMDADDVMHPRRLEITALGITSGEAVDVVGTHAFALSENDEVLGGYREGPLPEARDGYLRSNAMSHPTVAGWTSWFRANRYDETIGRAEDKELWMRTHRHSHFRKLESRLLYYRLPRTPDIGKVKATHRDNVALLKGADVHAKRRTQELLRAHVKNTVQTSMIRAGFGTTIQRRKIAVLSDAELREAQQDFAAAVRAPVS